MTRSHEEIGQQLKHAREKQGLTQVEAAEQLRMRIKYLRAMEHGKFDDLPGEIYVEGYIRSYAKLLGLDAGNIVKEFRTRPEKAELPKPKKISAERKRNEMLPSENLVIISLMVAAIIYSSWTMIHRNTMPSYQTSNPGGILLLANNNLKISLNMRGKNTTVMDLYAGQSVILPEAPEILLKADKEDRLHLYWQGGALHSFEAIAREDGAMVISASELERVMREQNEAEKKGITHASRR